MQAATLFSVFSGGLQGQRVVLVPADTPRLHHRQGHRLRRPPVPDVPAVGNTTRGGQGAAPGKQANALDACAPRCQAHAAPAKQFSAALKHLQGRDSAK